MKPSKISASKNNISEEIENGESSVESGENEMKEKSKAGGVKAIIKQPRRRKSK
jgi:hypothetical protein